MSADVTVIIPIFGDLDYWRPLAVQARASAMYQSLRPASVVVSEEADLCTARNRPAFEAETEWLCFLDADDELDLGYLGAMAGATGDVIQPSTLGVVDGVEDEFPVLIPERPLLTGNYIIVGALVRSELFRRVGGFDDWPMFEDWALWLDCLLAGATFGTCPEAIYRIHVRPGSRNGQMQLDTYNAIRREYEPLLRAKGLT